jgi:hypothetical protein
MRSLPSRPAAALAALLFAALPALADEPKADSAEARIRKDLGFLASEECEGRGVNTKGINKAADYIAKTFAEAGLKPPAGQKDYFQPFTMSAGKAELGEPNSVVLTSPDGKEIPLDAKQFSVVGLAGAGKASAGVVFVGYGVVAEELKYDDFAGVDVKDKIIVMLRRTPKPGDEDKPFDGDRQQQHAALLTKMMQADVHRAAGVLFVSDYHTARDGDELMPFAYTATASSPARLPAVHVKRELLDRMLQESRKTKLADVEAKIDKELKPDSAELTGWKATIQTSVTRPTVAVKNIVGVLEGAGPLAKETVVIGAHYDHLGYGGAGSLAKKKDPTIHFGADDNGSGSTALLELARRFGAMKNREGRRLVFIAFSGEESGLLGSAYYVKSPLYPLADTVAMINMDMVGRLRADKEDKTKDKLIVYGSGTAKTFDALLDGLNKKPGAEFKLSKVPGGTGPSDHTSFYLKGIPVLFFFTDTHREYHTPADTADTINYAGLARVVDMVQGAAVALATGEGRPEYVKIQSSMPTGGRMDIPRLGFTPGNYEEEDKGVLVAAVSAGGPGEKGGLKEDDLIVEVAGKQVRNMAGYMTAMKLQKKGQEMEMVVIRGGKRVPLKITPQ